MINANAKRVPTPNLDLNLNPYPTPNQEPNHYPHSISVLLDILQEQFSLELIPITSKITDVWMDGRREEELKDGWMGGWMKVWMDRWMNGRMDV